MEELPKEMIDRIRRSGRVHGIEDVREELMKHVKGNSIIIEVSKFSDLINKMEEE